MGFDGFHAPRPVRCCSRSRRTRLPWGPSIRDRDSQPGRLRRDVFAGQNPPVMRDWSLSGDVFTGLGQGRGFTRLDWVRHAFRQRLGIELHPGTLNLRLTTDTGRLVWGRVNGEPGIRIRGQQGACDARCYPVRVAGRYPAAIVLPEVPGYPADQVEVVAALGLREQLGLGDGDSVSLSGIGQARVAAVIFDVDGTLVDSVDAYHMAAGRAAEPFGYAVTRDMVRQALNDQRNFWELVIPDPARRTDATIERLRRDTMHHWRDVLDEHVTVFPGLSKTLDALRAAGVRLGIYTGSQGQSLPPLAAAGLLDHFEVVLTAADIARVKPHPEGILRCLEHLRVPAADAAYVGDSVQDMAAAQAAGARAIGMLTGAADSAALSSAGAHRLAAGHAALLEILLPNHPRG